ncbi:MAG: protein phosphatase 2C domain-containing protein [Methylotenera sp.]|nr:protein phosphatase 2C domain-containing protein [Oligoflexia bacterium]
MTRSQASKRIKASLVFSSQGALASQEDFVLGKKDRGLFVVADGFGGVVPGALASRTACEAVLGFLQKEAGDIEATLPFVLRSYYSLAGNVLFNALVHANRQVLRLNQKKNVHERGGASVIAGFLDEDLMAIAHVGACGAWLFRSGMATELVTPRTYARLSDPFNKEVSDGTAVPLMALGISQDLEPEIVELRVRPGDWLLLQSDGMDQTIREGLLKIQTENLTAAQSAETAEAYLKQCRFIDNASASLTLF